MQATFGDEKHQLVYRLQIEIDGKSVPIETTCEPEDKTIEVFKTKYGKNHEKHLEAYALGRAMTTMTIALYQYRKDMK